MWGLGWASGWVSSALMFGGHNCRSACPQTTLVVQAVQKDQEGDWAAALSLYCQALDFFVPALHCESTVLSYHHHHHHHPPHKCCCGPEGLAGAKA